MAPSGSTLDSTYYSLWWSGTSEDFMDSSIVITFEDSFPRFIPDYLFLFKGTKVASSSLPTSPSVLSDSCSTSGTTDAYLLPSGTTDVSIGLSSFKLDSNSLIMTLLLKIHQHK